jgi:hypothetical protein
MTVAPTDQDGTGDDTQAITESTTLWQPQQLGRLQITADAEQAGDIFGRAVDAVAGVFDEVTALGQLADLDLGIGVEAVVGEFLHDEAGDLVHRDAATLLQAFEGTERGPVLELEPSGR